MLNPDAIANSILLGDCLELLRELPDQSVDLVLTDPPYGGSVCRTGGRTQRYESGEKINNERRDGIFGNKGLKISDWDIAPTEEVFAEIFRVSKNQVIWGGNYFKLPPTRCFNVWRKLTISEEFTMAMCEYAWTSFDSNAKWWEYAPQDKNRFHPTQKPVQLICRQLEEYSKPGDLVLDPFSGSGTVAVACHLTGRRFIACEINEDYHARSVQRLAAVTAQPLLL